MTIRERYAGVVGYFLEHNPEAQTELNYSNPYELLVAVVLSAQCTDRRVNLVTPRLFEAFPDPLSLSLSTPDTLLEYISSVSYPNSKASHLVGMARMLVSEYRGVVPSQVEELMRLPGVGRKTANVIASVIYQKPAMAVDTHVYRVSRRIGLVPQTANTPLKVEKALLKHLPEEYVATAHHWLILHGRYVCTARSPKCSTCGISSWCRYYKNKAK